MRLCLATMDEFQVVTCLEQELWGAKRSRIKAWGVGDLLAFKASGRGQRPRQQDPSEWLMGSQPHQSERNRRTQELRAISSSPAESQGALATGNPKEPLYRSMNSTGTERGKRWLRFSCLEGIRVMQSRRSAPNGR
jgi:hypothetical protein